MQLIFTPMFYAVQGQFLLKKMMDDNSIMAPSKCIKVVKNTNWPEREKQVIVEQCTENSNVIHRTITLSVSEVAD